MTMLNGILIGNKEHYKRNWVEGMDLRNTKVWVNHLYPNYKVGNLKVLILRNLIRIMALNRNRPIRPPRSIEKRTDSLDNVEALKQDLRDIFKPKEIEPEIKPKLHASKLPERDTQSLSLIHI